MSAHASPSRWQRYVRLLDAREPATAMALLRIGVGLVLLFDLSYLGVFDLVDVVYGDGAGGNLGASTGAARPTFLVEQFGADAARVAHTTAFISGLAFTTGTFTRLSGLVFLGALVMLRDLYPLGDRGIDQLLRLVIVYILMSGSHETLSVHARWRHGAWARPNARIPAWPRYLVLVQVIWMYFTAGAYKTTAEWAARGDYMALFYVLRYKHFVRWDMNWVPSWLTQVLTFVTIWFELLAPVTLWAAYRHQQDPHHERRGTGALHGFRMVWTLIGLGLHVTLWIIMNIGIFTTGMLVMYFAWISPPMLRRAPLAWLRHESGPDGEPATLDDAAAEGG